MISDYRCFFCFTRAVEKLLQKEPISGQAKGFIVDDMINAYQNSRNNFSAPEFSREINLIIRKYSGNNDLYKEEKEETNRLAVSMLPELTRITEKSDDRFNTALRIAIAGNIMDFAANDNFNLHETVQKTLKEDFAIDHSAQLKEALKNAGSVLYLGDNAGEIVFDKL
ncbi:MAG TPA: ARMT1-like domain-containing protein, partial [Bacteroidales bacterium]|nr:ARMT1-like domain-containing protein [Bacteroidales bacterium]